MLLVYSATYRAVPFKSRGVLHVRCYYVGIPVTYSSSSSTRAVAAAPPRGASARAAAPPRPKLAIPAPALVLLASLIHIRRTRHL